jgi:hypothetical protein
MNKKRLFNGALLLIALIIFLSASVTACAVETKILGPSSEVTDAVDGLPCGTMAHQVNIMSGYWIDSLEMVVQTPDGATHSLGMHGYVGGGPATFTLENGEYINEVSGDFTPPEIWSPSVLYTIKFTTNLGRTATYGADGGTLETTYPGLTPFDYIAPDGWQILGFTTSKDAITTIGVIAIPVRAPESLETKFQTLSSFEQLLRDQHNLLNSLDDLMGQTPVTKQEKIEFLYSIEDLYRRQAIGMDKFSVWIDENWNDLTAEQKARVTSSLEDLLRRQARNIDSYNGNLLAWVITFDQPYRQKFSDSLEDLLHRQVNLLEKFEDRLHQDGMQTPRFLSSFEDLLRRQANSLMGFGDLGELIFNNTTQEGPGIAIYKTADKTSLACGENVTYKYTVYNIGDEDLTNITVTDSYHGYMGNISSLGVYQSKSIAKTVTTGCLPDVVYPIYVCNTATATGTTISSEQTVQATSNKVCIILNGPRQPGPGQCGEINGVQGYPVSINGNFKKVSDTCWRLNPFGNPQIDISLKPGSIDQQSWNNLTNLTDGTCIWVKGCLYNLTDPDSTCITGSFNELMYVSSYSDSLCPQTNCNSGEEGVVVEGYIELNSTVCDHPTLTDLTGYQYGLNNVTGYEDAWAKIMAIVNNGGGCAEVSGCINHTSSVCQQGMTLNVKEVKEIDCSELSCPYLSGHEGHKGTAQGVIYYSQAPGPNPIPPRPFINYGPWLTTDDGSTYLLSATSPEIANEISDIANISGCARVSGCFYEDLPEIPENPASLWIFVTSIEQIDCPCVNMTGSDGNTYVGKKDDLKGNITKISGNGGDCYVLTEENGVKHELWEDENNESAWETVGDLVDQCAEITGCSYDGMPTNCSDDGSPLVVRSCVACNEPIQTSCPVMHNTVTNKDVSGFLATKIGPLGDVDSCPYRLDYSYQETPNGPTITKKYWLTAFDGDEQSQEAYNNLTTSGAVNGTYIKVRGCIYEGLGSPCDSVPDAIPMYVRSVVVYTTPCDSSQAPFIDRGTVDQNATTGVTSFSSVTGHGKFELLEDTNYPDAWDVINHLKGTSKLVEVYGCEDMSNTIPVNPLYVLHLRAAVPLAGAMVVNPKNATGKVIGSTQGCTVCKG